ncbi:MAG: glycoside hydrolase family 32 protein [Saprospiraceae bacterium]
MKNLLFISIILFAFSCQSEKAKIIDNQVIEPAKFMTNAISDYQEQHRLQFHFSPDSMWMNDPNGMVYYEGEYHLFYQHYPDSNVWGPMHWGHAVSEDLVHWQHLPIGLYPDSLGLIFSGSAVVDWNNTSGFGKDGTPPLIAIFTHHLMAGEKGGRNDFQYQSIAYSNDKGRTWTTYEGNPVIPNTEKIRDFRDPKVIWDAENEQWLMVFAVQNRVRFYASADLKQWDLLSEFGEKIGAHGGVWECPDFFPMTDQATDETKWVLLSSINPGSYNGGSGTQYFVGDWDGKTFTLDAKFIEKMNAQRDKAVWLDYGRDNYAGVTWSDIDRKDGRRIFMGWMSNWDYAQIVPTTHWRSAMTIARTLELTSNTPNGYTVISQAVNEMEKIRGLLTELQPFDLQDSTRVLTEELAFSPATSEVILEMKMTEDAMAYFILTNAKGEEYYVGYNAAANEFFSDRQAAGKQDFSEKFAADNHTAPRNSTNETIKMHLFFDTASAEIFADDGTVVMTDIFFPNEDFNQLKIEVIDGKVEVERLDVYELKSIW